MIGSALRAVVLAGCSLVFAAAAAAEETTLLFATTNPPNVHLNMRVLHPWAARVNEQGAGTLRLDVRDGPAVANHTNYYDRTLNDVIQIAWGLHTGAAGKFPRIEVTGIPFVVESAEVSSVSLYRLYKSGVLDAEYDEVIPLMFVGFPPNQLHMRASLKTLDDLNGLKVLAGTKSASEVVAALGGAPVSLSITENYQALQRGTADGTLLVWTAFQPFKLAEVTKYHVEVPLGSGTGHVMMAKKKYVALPEAVRRLIDANAMEKETRIFGAFWDVVQEEGRDMAKSAGHTIVELTPAQTGAWKQKLAGIETEWVKRTPDGANVLARYRALVAQVKAGS